MEYKVKEAISLEEGKHKGEIVKLEERNYEKYSYLDIFIKPDSAKDDFTVKYGVPANISVKTRLGKLLSEFTILDVGAMIRPEKILKGKKVSFMIIQNEDGYNEVVPNSVKKLDIERQR